MNVHDRDAIERLIEVVAGLKGELIATNQHLERIELSIAKHFLDDAAWMRAHDLRQGEAAVDAARAEGAKQQRAPLIRLGLDIAKVAAGAGILYLARQLGVNA